VSEIMTRTPLCTLPSDADTHAAAALMTEQGIHRILVVDDDQLVGIVSSLDVARAVAEHKLTERTFVFNHDRMFGA
ncbi:MAG: CBS domain-containing protein, partial [Gemmatimonadaceae bacterium]